MDSRGFPRHDPPRRQHGRPQPRARPTDRLANAEAERPPSAASEPAERPPPVASGPAELLKLEFGWPLPAQAIVEEWVEKPGESAKLRYRIDVELQGEQLLVHQSELNGAELEGHLLQAGFIPSMAASLDGEFIRVIDMDAYVERAREALASDPEQNEAALSVLRSPQMIPVMEQKIGDIWRGWVEIWAGLETWSDQELRIETGMSVGVYRVVELDAETISLEFRFERELSISQIRSIFGAMFSGAGDDLAKMEAELEGVTSGATLVATATLRRDTLLPLRCSRQEDMWIEFPGEPRETRRELHRYTFEWQ